MFHATYIFIFYLRRKESMDLDPEAVTVIFQIFILFIFTLVNAFFSSAEIAIVSVNKTKIRQLANDGNKKALLLQDLCEESATFLSTIQVVLTFAGFFSSAYAAIGISQTLGHFMNQFSIPFSFTIAIVLVTILLSFVSLVFGELVPKRIALQKADLICFITVRPVLLFSKLLSPFIHLLSFTTNLVLQLIGMNTENIEEAVSEEEIKAMLETGSETGVFNEIEKKMINSIFLFDDKAARDIMVPRREVFAIDIEEPFHEYIDDILESRHSRIPVYSQTIDNIIGILYIKDFIIKMRTTSFSNMNIRPLLKKPFFVPDSKNTDDLFREMQFTQNRMAILIDEYGGFSGIVTMEDLVEEIMGDIGDDHGDTEEDIQQLDEGTYLLNGGTLIKEINDKLHMNLKTENYDTLSGFLIEHLGYIPKRNDQSAVTVDDAIFQIKEVKDKRIQKVELRLPLIEQSLEVAMP